MDPAELIDATDEDDHLHEAATSLNDLVTVGYRLIEQDTEARPRDAAINLGLAVRTVKLSDDILRDATQGDSRLGPA